MKKLVLAVLFVFALSSVAIASPLTDFSLGKAALDLNYRSSPDYDANVGINGIGKTDKIALDGDNNLEWGFTYGIGNNWALQYRQAAPKGTLGLIDVSMEDEMAARSYYNPITSLNASLEAKTKVDEYNVLYKMNKNFAFFTGIVKAAPSAKLSIGVGTYENSYSGDIAIAGHDKNIWQFGLQAVAPFADKFTGYGIAAFGSDYRNWEVGVGYQLSKNLEFNVNYRDMRIDNMSMVGLSIPTYNGVIGDVTSDVQQKGLGFGVTYKF